LDIFATNKPALVSTCQPIPGVSDHDGIYMSALSVIVHHKPCPRKVYIWKKANFQAIKDELCTFFDGFVATYGTNFNINDLCCSFKQKCMELLKKWIPSKNMSVRFHQPWIISS